jgi:hypothetical protein
MDDNKVRDQFMVESTDYLEAIGVFRGWKNSLFAVVLLCLLILQLSFWLVDRGFIGSEDKVETSEVELEAVKPPEAEDLVTPLEESQANQAGDTLNEIEKAAKSSLAEEQASGSEEVLQVSTFWSFFGIKIGHINWVVRICNFVLILAAILYCLAMLFSFKISLIGRLGGIKHICRAFLLSLIMVVLLLPWQMIYGKVVLGAIYTPDEMLTRCATEPSGIFNLVLHYLRFTGYVVLVLLLLILSQIRSSRWTKAVLHRLEII